MRSYLRADQVAFWNRLIPTLMARRDAWLGDGAWYRSVGGLTTVLWSLAAVCVVLVAAVAFLSALQVRHCRKSRRRATGTAVGRGTAAAGCKPAVETAAVAEKHFNNSGSC